MCVLAKNGLLWLQWSNLFKIFDTVCFDYQEAVEDDLDALYRGLASTLGEKEDHIMVEDLAGQELQRKYKKHIFTWLSVIPEDLDVDDLLWRKIINLIKPSSLNPLLSTR